MAKKINTKFSVGIDFLKKICYNNNIKKEIKKVIGIKGYLIKRRRV